ncbi:MAG: O-antigen ligase family protein [Patescibacteria group bacterium]|jgi:O-antigen ligase
MTPTLLAAILAAIAAALFLALCLRDRTAAIAVFAALLPTYLMRFNIPLPGLDGAGLPTTFLELLFLILFGCWFAADGRHPSAWRPLKRWMRPAILLLTGATLAVFVSPELRAAAGIWRAYFLEPLLFFVVFADTVKDRRQIDIVLFGLGSGLAVVSLAAIYQKFTGFGIPNPVWQAAATRRVTSFFGYPNAVSLYAVPVIVLLAARAFSLLRSKIKMARIVGAGAALAAALGVLAILFAVSEGGAIALAAGLLVLGLLLKPLRAATLSAIIVACLVISLYRPVTDYAAGIYSLRDDSGSVRLIVWQESLAMLADHPVFGAGLAGYQQALAPYHQAKHIEIFMYPHNLVLNFWSEIGLIGLVGFLWLVVLAVIANVRLVLSGRSGWLAPALLAALAALLVHGLVDVPYFKNDLAMIFWLLIGLTETAATIAQGTKPTPTLKPETT